MWRSILFGIVWVMLGAFPVAALVALCYRFPIPFSGYESGLMAVPKSLMSVVFYELFGGFIVLALLGIAAGLAANFLARSDVQRERRLVLIFALVGDFLAVMTLAVLDKIIGPW